MTNGGAYRISSRDGAPPALRIRLNWPLAILLLGTEAIIAAVWTSLVLAKFVPVDSLWHLATFLAGLTGGSTLPVVQWFRAHPVTVDLATTDTPPK